MNNKGRVPLKEKNLEFSRFGLTHPPTPKSPKVWGIFYCPQMIFRKFLMILGKIIIPSII